MRGPLAPVAAHFLADPAQPTPDPTVRRHHATDPATVRRQAAPIKAAAGKIAGTDGLAVALRAPRRGLGHGNTADTHSAGKKEQED